MRAAVPISAALEGDGALSEDSGEGWDSEADRVMGTIGNDGRAEGWTSKNERRCVR